MPSSIRTFIIISNVFLISCDAARILGFFSSVSYSNLIIYTAVTEALAEDGHNVTVLANYPNPGNKKNQDNYHFIHLNNHDEFDGQRLVNNNWGHYGKGFRIIDERMQCANRTLNHSKMLRFLKEHSERDYDLVIIGFSVMAWGLGAHFQCPIVVVLPSRPFYNIERLIGNPSEVSYYPRLTKAFKPPFNMKEKLQNWFAYGIERFVLQSYVKRQDEKFYR
ncbi:UDP-glycosyltransferase UGT4-like [Musca autumnalis]|uniref:UDP-glycosyltransferase UGT4-like n=1 Tax=Musca autumnalis TaxID=221902 RepID=UPI003CEC2401